jgi:hypothetical protein
VPASAEHVAFEVLLAAEGKSEIAELYLGEQTALDDGVRRQCFRCLVAKYQAMTPEQRQKAEEEASDGVKERRAVG